MADYFPPEVIEEILRRLPLKSLVKCISVCKAWKSLITHHAFISDHLTHTLHFQANHGNSSLFLHLHSMRGKSADADRSYEEFYSLYSNEETDRLLVLEFPLTHLFRFKKPPAVVGTCNGLVCFADYSVLDGANAIIWNPSIRKFVVLPKPTLTFERTSGMDERYEVFFGFGFDSRNNDFKIVRFVTLHETEATPQVEIYSLATRSWRSITATAPPFLLSKHVWKPHQMFVNGVLHWVVTRRSGGRIHNFILSFDVAEETFGELMLPQCLKESPFQVSILAGGDSLAVLHKNNSYFEQNFFSIWVMKEYGALESWTQLSHFDSTSSQGTPSVLALRSSGEVVLKSSSDGIILLNPTKELVKKLGLKGYFNTFAGDHVESLFLMNEKM